ncbi:MAG: hypothetical protein MOGMAGMI_00805 [Candidatus Omnitrophica bacterium]|nr:hypothetical protein [Candidatus Omnitrophota bacterium]
MKSRGRPLRRIAVLTGIIAALAGAYLHFGLLPGDLKPYALERVGPHLGVRVDFSKAIYLPFRGLTFEQVKIWDLQGRPLFKARALAINLSAITFFREKRIVIQNLYLDRPAYDLRLDTLRRKPRPQEAPPMTRISGQIEVPVAGTERAPSLRQIAHGPDMLLPENVYLEQVEVRRGIMTIRETADSPIIERVRSADLRIAFRRPPVVRLSGKVELGEDRYTNIRLEGTYDLKSSAYEFVLRVDGKRLPNWASRLQQGRSIRLEKARYALSARVGRAEDHGMAFRAQAHLSGADLCVSSSAFTGQTRADISGVFDPDDRSVRDFRAVLQFERLTATGLGKDIGRLDALSGQAALSPDLIEIRSVQGTFRGLPFQADGTVRSFKDLTLDLTVKTATRINSLLAVLPEDQKRLFSGLHIDGPCHATTRLRGSLKGGGVSATKEHAVVLEQAQLHHSGSGLRLTDLSARIDVNDSGITVKGARFKHGAAAYRMELSIPKAANTDGRFELSTARFKARAEYRTDGQDLRILKGRYETRGLKLGVQGRIKDLKDPYLSVEGELSADLRAAREEFADRQPALRDLSVSGDVSGYYRLDGYWDRPKDWALSMDLESPGVELARLELDRLRAQVRMRDRKLDIPYIQAAPYGGYLGAKVLVDLDRAIPSYEGRLHANNIDVARLGRSLGSKDPKLAGTAILQSTFSGRVGETSSLRGQGALTIRDGHLWETSQFKQMGELVLVKVEGLDNVVFEDLNATFALRDGRLWTQDLTLMGSTVDLSLRGSVSFRQELDLMMSIQYSSDVYQGAMDAGGIVPLVLNQASNLISEYRIGGTMAAPTYTKAGAGRAQSGGR